MQAPLRFRLGLFMKVLPALLSIRMTVKIDTCVFLHNSVFNLCHYGELITIVIHDFMELHAHKITNRRVFKILLSQSKYPEISVSCEMEFVFYGFKSLIIVQFQSVAESHSKLFFFLNCLIRNFNYHTLSCFGSITVAVQIC